MGRALRRLSVAVVAALVVAVVAACESPTLPLPPPELPGVTNQSNGQALPAGQVKLISKHGAQPNAVIVTYNGSPRLPLDQRVGGAQADGLGSWDAIIWASAGDFVDVTQEFGDTRSPPTTVQIPTLP